MFEQTFVESTGRTNKTWTVMLSFVLQIGILIVLIILPMILFDKLPAAQLASFLVAPPPPPPPPPPPAAAAPVRVVHVIPRQFDAGRLMAPKSVPKDIAVIREDELPPPSAGGGVGVVGGTGVGGGGVMGGILGGMPVAPPPPPPTQKKDLTPQRIRVGGNVQQAKLMSQPRPVYPPLAKSARIQGTVRLSAVIAIDGTIKDLTVVSGHPLLIPNALEAVKRWRYAPTLLNGEPVEVMTQIDVNFTLSN